MRSLLVVPAGGLAARVASPLASCDSSGTVAPSRRPLCVPIRRPSTSTGRPSGTRRAASCSSAATTRRSRRSSTSRSTTAGRRTRASPTSARRRPPASSSSAGTCCASRCQLERPRAAARSSTQQAWLAKLDAVLAMAHEHSFYVFVDMHQDAYSKEIGEDGEPLWAIVPPPTQLLEGPYSDARRDDRPGAERGLQLLRRRAGPRRPPAPERRSSRPSSRWWRHVLGDPAVLGYEDFNEPVVLQRGRARRVPPGVRRRHPRDRRRRPGAVRARRHAQRDRRRPSSRHALVERPGLVRRAHLHVLVLDARASPSWADENPARAGAEHGQRRRRSARPGERRCSSPSSAATRRRRRVPCG